MSVPPTGDPAPREAWDIFRRTLAFVIGLIIVLFGLLDECPRVGAIAIGLLLMGVFTVPEALGIVGKPKG
jgi:hypothetical protein